jgi:hypothetical protein
MGNIKSIPDNNSKIQCGSLENHDVCEYAPCIRTIEGLDDNSASPYDT